MSTRGTFGFKRTADELNRDDIFVVYNGSDSYYSGLGAEMLQMYLSLSKEQLINIFNNINWVNQRLEVDDYDYLYYQYDSILSHVFNPDREKITLYNDKEFFDHGLFCEYSYLYNLETDCLEFYRGIFGEPQELTQTLGREPRKVYHTCKVLELNRENYMQKILFKLDDLEKELDS